MIWLYVAYGVIAIIVDFIAIQDLMDQWEDDDPFAATIGALIAGLFWPITVGLWVWRWYRHRPAPQQGEG